MTTQVVEPAPIERHLETQLAVSRLLAAAPILEEALGPLLRTLCEGLEWDLGEFWLVDQESGALRRVAAGCAPGCHSPHLEAASKDRVFARSEGVPGRVWASGAPLWIPDVTRDDNLPRAAAAARDGLHGCCAFPVNAGTEVAAVLAFFSREIRPPDRPLSLLMASIGALVGAFLEQGRVKAALHARESELRSLVEATPDAMVLADACGRILLVNAQTERLFGYARAELLGGPVEILIPERFRPGHPAHRAGYFKDPRVRPMGTGPSLFARRRDGTEFPVEISLSHQDGPRGRIALAAIRDVSERARAEEWRAGQSRILERIAAGLPLEDTLVELVRFVESQSEGMLGSILLLEPDGLHVSHAAAPSLPKAYTESIDGASIGPSAGSCGTAMYRRQLVVVADIETDPLWTDYRHLAAPHGLRACWSKPILSSQGRVLGSFAMYYREPRSPTPAETDLIEVASHLAGIAIDRLRSEAALVESEQRFRSVFDRSEIGIAIADVRGRELMVNAAYRHMVGSAEGDLCSVLRFDELTHPDDRAADAARYRDLVAGKCEQYQQEKRYLLDDGRLVWVSLTVSLLRDAGGDPQYVLGTAADLTERKRAEEALRRSEEEYRRFFEADLSANYVSKPDGALLACNSAFARLFGFSSVAEALASGLSPLYASPEAQHGILDLLRRRERIEGYSHRLRRSDGSPVFVVQNAVGRFDAEGELVEVHGFIVDETGRRAAEDRLRQTQRIEAVGRLAGGVAHDFNNLLGVIAGHCDLLNREFESHEVAKARLAQIRRAADRAADLTRQLLAFSRKQVLDLRIVGLNRVVADVQEMLRRLIGEDIQFSTVLAEDLGNMRADPGQVEQVIVNLVLNARDAMPDGGRIVLETANVEIDDSWAARHPGAASGPHVMLAVSDTGCGMSQETLSHIFEPFYTTKEQGKGTGLGLATVHGIVQQSGGVVSVYSEPGLGSTFKVYLPRVAESTDAAPEPREAPAPPPAGSETLLLVEDDDAVRGVVREILATAGYTVLECRGPEEALGTGQSHPDRIHLLLTDVVMPRMSGRMVAERLATVRPSLKILYMSGYTDDAVVRRGVLESPTHFISKPFAPDALLRRIREILDAP